MNPLHRRNASANPAHGLLPTTFPISFVWRGHQHLLEIHSASFAVKTCYNAIGVQYASLAAGQIRFNLGSHSMSSPCDGCGCYAVRKSVSSDSMNSFLAISERRPKEYYVFPNPSSGLVTISNALHSKAIIRNSIGVVVHQVDNIKDGSSVDLRFLPKEIYFFTFLNGVSCKVVLTN